jgi:hypothetical protein
MSTPIPAFDPLGLPLPPILLQVLSYLTLTLHFAAMQYTVGGALVMLWAWKKEPKIARFFGTGLPLGFSYLVTFGIPPLLFVQVMYGQFFYSSSVLIGAFWISVIPLIIVGYGAAYWHRITRENRPKYQMLLIGTTTAIVLTIGFIYVNNLTLSMTPARWMNHYQANPGGGALNLSEPTLWPRYGFFIVPAIFVAGLTLLLRGGYLSRRNPEAAKVSRRIGVNLAIGASVLQAIFSFALFSKLPKTIAAQLTVPGIYSGLAIAATVLGLAALGVAILSTKRTGMGLAILAAHLYFVADACVVILRDLVRQLYLAPYYKLSEAPVVPQWGMFFGFVLALVLGLVFLIVVTKQMVGGLVKTDPILAGSPAE